MIEQIKTYFENLERLSEVDPIYWTKIGYC